MTANPDTHHRIFGKGPRPALAFHCTLSHSGEWRDVGNALSRHVTLTAIDLPGHGKSRDWDGQTDFQTVCVKRAERFLNGPLDLIGHSFGASVALRIAIEHPHLVRSLTLIEPVLFAAAGRYAPRSLAAYLDELAPVLSALDQQDMPLAAQRFNRLWGDGRNWDDIPEALRRYIAGRMHLVAAQSPALFDGNAKVLQPGQLERASMPTVLIEGDQSPAVIGAIHDVLASRLPDVRRCVIAGAGHMSPVTHPDDVAAAMKSVLEMVQE